MQIAPITPVQQKAANQLGAGLGESKSMITAPGTTQFNLAIDSLRAANADFTSGNQTCGGILMGGLGGQQLQGELSNAADWMRQGVQVGVKRLTPSLVQELLDGADLLDRTAARADSYVNQHESDFGDVSQEAAQAFANVINTVQEPLGEAVGFQVPAPGPALPAK